MRINHTITSFADHVENMSHDAINRFLRDKKMTPHLVHHKGLACRTVLKDTWYAAKERVLFIESQGKIIKIRGFPKEHKIKLFRVKVSTHHTDMVVTNDLTRNLMKEAQQLKTIRLA